MNKILLNTSMAVLLGISSAAQAGFLFDADGTGSAASAVNIDTFDIAPTSVLAKGGNQAVANFLNGSGPTTFQVFTQGKITNLLSGGSSVGAIPGGAELTVTLGFTEQVTDAGFIGPNGSAFFTPVPGAGPNFIEIYYDSSANSSQFNGTGFGADAGAVKIFSSKVTGDVGGPNSFTTTQGSSSLLDQNGADNWAAANGGSGQLSVNGTGNQSSLVLESSIPPAFVHTDFFKNIASIVSAFVIDINLNAPFISAGTGNDPMRQFITTAGASDANYTVWDGTGAGTTLGLLNGGLTKNSSGTWVASGPDFLFSTDANITLSATTVPEPSAILIVAIGLLGFAFSTKKSASV